MRENITGEKENVYKSCEKEKERASCKRKKRERERIWRT